MQARKNIFLIKLLYVACMYLWVTLRIKAGSKCCRSRSFMKHADEETRNLENLWVVLHWG